MTLMASEVDPFAGPELTLASNLVNGMISVIEVTSINRTVSIIVSSYVKGAIYFVRAISVIGATSAILNISATRTLLNM